MKRSARLARMKVTSDGEGLVSHAGAELLKELAGHTGLIDAWDAVLVPTYKAMPIHFPGSVLCDLAVAIADGADSISDLRVLRGRPDELGEVASDSTAWRVLDRVKIPHLLGLRQGRAAARARAWSAGAAPDLTSELSLDIDATIVIAHSDKELASPTWKRTFGFHPLLCFLDRPEIASGEALAGILRHGGAGSNTAVDHVKVLKLALDNLPEQAQPRKDDPSGPRVVVRSDSAGATHTFAGFCRDEGCAFSFGFPITAPVRDAICSKVNAAWAPAIDDEDGAVREGALVTEITDRLDLSSWPVGSRVVVRRERPHPGAQLSLFDVEAGWRHTAFILAGASGTERDERPVALLELRHRRHARVEDRIRQAKAAGLRNLPCKEAAENEAWLECVLAAADLVTWSKLVCFADDPELARCEIDTFRYRVLHIAARLARHGRTVHLRLDRTWSWARQLALAFTRLRAAFA